MAGPCSPFMLQQLKPLVPVLAFALLVFVIAKPVCLRFMEEADFTRRRNVWLVLTCAAFASPNLWVFAGVAMPVVLWATHADRHPAALYLFLLSTVPPVSVAIPFAGINQLFDLSPSRILALAILVPAAIRIARSGQSGPAGIVRVDLVLLAWGLLQLALYMPYESSTNTLRRGFLFVLDTYVLFYVFSRGTTTMNSMRDTMASLAVACAVLVPIAAFETVKGWLLFQGIPSEWGAPISFAFLMRDDLLRAQGPAGHSLVLGYLFSVAFGCWLYLGTRLESARKFVLIACGFWVGLISANSRAPWIIAAFVLLVFMVMSPVGRRHFLATSIGVVISLIGVSMTSLGERILASLPFVGTTDQGNVDYREQLATVSWRLIKQNPFFGSPTAGQQMEELRQGQGIIDLVNTYASVGVFYGLVGVALFVSCYLYPMLRTFLAMRALGSREEDMANLGAALLALMLGLLLFLATVSFWLAIENLAWVLAGLCSAYPAAVALQRRTARLPVGTGATGVPSHIAPTRWA